MIHCDDYLRGSDGERDLQEVRSRGAHGGRVQRVRTCHHRWVCRRQHYSVIIFKRLLEIYLSLNSIFLRVCHKTLLVDYIKIFLHFFNVEFLTLFPQLLYIIHCLC